MFESAIEPFTANARERVEQEVRKLGQTFDSDERSALAQSFHESVTRELSARLARIFVLELNLARAAGALTSNEPAGRLREFVEQAGTAKFRETLFATYPSLRDRVDKFLGNAAEAHVAMTQRLAADRDLLAASFGLTGRLIAVDVGMGDRHRGGRTVNSLEFSDAKLVYKPRSLSVDNRLAELVDHLGRGLDQVSLGVPRCLDRGSYGWAQFVEYRECDTEQDVRHFYRSMGAWLAVMRLLRGTDMHAENIIASGRTPVVVDCETLFTPPVVDDSMQMSDADKTLWATLAATIATSLILPSEPIDGTDIDLSALGYSVDDQTVVRVPRIVDENTDTAHVAEGDVAVSKINSCAPKASVQPADYLDELLDGFRLYVDRIAALDRESRLPAILSGFERCELRFVPRATKYYMDLMRTLWHPAGFYEQDRTVDQIATLLTSDDVADAFPLPTRREIVNAEIEDLLVGDVPYFSVAPENGEVIGPDGTPVSTFGNLVDNAIAQWRRIDQALEEQLIKTTMVSTRSAAGLSGHWRVEQFADRRHDRSDASPVGDLIEGLAHEICVRATRGNDGSVNWMGTVIGRKGTSLGPLGFDLYGGLPGMMVSLAAYKAAEKADIVSVNNEVADLLERCIRSVLRGADADGRDARTNGAYSGPASRVFAWLLVHRILGDDQVLEYAMRAANELRASLPSTEGSDVMSGLAGAMAALVNVHEFVRDDVLLRDAIGVANTLEGLAVDAGDGTVYWHTDGHDRSGFAHGATGIGWALNRLAVATSEDKWRDLAKRALAFDEPTRLGERGTTEYPSPRLSNTWCYGASGVGLAHADLATATGGVGYHVAQAAAATEKVLAAPLTGSHSLCHGDLSCAELVYQRVDDRGTRQSYANSIYRDLSERGPHVGETNDAYTPSLMDGIGGVMYQLIRLTVGDGVPSIFVPFVGRR